MTPEHLAAADIPYGASIPFWIYREHVSALLKERAGLEKEIERLRRLFDIARTSED